MKNLPSYLSFLPLYLLSFCILILLISPVQAKKRCKPLLEKLHNVQAMQRNGYSLKRGQSLRAKEDKARGKWWQCEHSSRYTKANKGKKKSKKTGGNINKRKQVAANKSRQLYLAKKATSAPFNSRDAIVIKSKFQGDKKFAWLAFYQQPIKCQRAKKLDRVCYL